VVSLEFSNARCVPVGRNANEIGVVCARMLAYGMVVSARERGGEGSVKIAYFVSRYPQQCQTFVRREIDEVVRQGHTVTIFPIVSAASAARMQSSDACACSSVIYSSFFSPTSLWRACSRSPQVCFSLLGGLIRDTWRRPATFVKAMLAFSRGVSSVESVKGGGFDHIHAHWASYPTTAAMTVSALTGIPFSFAFHAYDLFSTRIQLAKKLSAASVAVLNSQYSIAFLRRLYPDLASDCIMLLYNGLDRSRFAEQARARPPDLSCPLVLGVGRLVATKGFRDLVEACHLMVSEGRTCRLVLIGSGPEEGRLRQLIDQYELEACVTLTGELPQKDVSRYLDEATMLVMPCIAPRAGDSHDALPNVIIEAQAAGVPVVASNVFAIPETVRHEETGLLVPPGDADALSRAIIRVADDSPLAERIARRGWEEAKTRFDVHSNVERLIQQFERARESVGRSQS
jgi:colanic acid/amylovoran biosynthesis glycosyltransferase